MQKARFIILVTFLLFYPIQRFSQITDSSSVSDKDKSKTMMEEVRDFSKKDNFLSKVLRTLFTVENEDTIDRSGNYKEFRNHEGKIIRKINVYVLNVFGGSIYDTTKRANSWLQRTGNAIHINTQNWLIKNKLLFAENDLLHPLELEESERLLRESNYIYDSRILVAETNIPGTVDVNVYIQDVWSITGDASINTSVNSGFISAKDLNFLGFGSELSTKIKFADNYRSGWNWDGKYLVSNINRTFFSGQIYHYQNDDNLIYGFGVNRDFFSFLTKWAGGINFEWGHNNLHMSIDSNIVNDRISFNRKDIWLGYATDFAFLTKRSSQNKYNFSARVINTEYLNEPIHDSSNHFRNNIIYLGRIGYSYKNYYKDNYIFGLGKTEDIPAGSLVGFLFGLEKSDDGRKRPYYGIYGGLSKFNFNFGFLYGGFQTGAFRENKSWTDGAFAIDFMYITKLFHYNSIKIRHYAWSRFGYIYNSPFAQNFLNINGSNGIRGFSSLKIGNRKLALNYENNIFTPLHFLGFNFAFISFADFAMVAQPNESLLKTKIYQGFGVGVRLRNEHLVFGTIQLMFGYYPTNHQNNFNYFDQSQRFFDYNQFLFSKPSIISIDDL